MRIVGSLMVCGESRALRRPNLGIPPLIERESGQYSRTGTGICLRRRNRTSGSRRGSGEEFSFLFNSLHETRDARRPLAGAAAFRLPPNRVNRRRGRTAGKSASSFEASRAPPTALENRGLESHSPARPYSSPHQVSKVNSL